jgi:hypothetical protein
MNEKEDIMSAEKNITFKSTMSKWIAGLYFVTLLAMIIMLIAIPLFAPMTMMERNVFIVAFLIFIIIIGFILYRGYRMRFIISKDDVIIHGLMKNHAIKQTDIQEIQKIPIPLGFRYFGASLLGGRYYYPGIGKAIVNMSNFDDGVLIKTKKEPHYVITPENPSRFIELLNKKMKYAESYV